MRLLLDSSIWGKAGPELRAAGHDVTWVGDWPEDPGDVAILAKAHRESRILVTADKDFGELAVRQRRPHVSILHLVKVPVRQQASLCLQVLTLHEAELLAGGIITAGMERLRIRPAES